MTKNSSIPQKKSFFWYFVGWIGLVASLLTVSVGFVLPFLYPPALKWKGFIDLFHPIWPSLAPLSQALLPAAVKQIALVSSPLQSFTKLLNTPIFIGFLLSPCIAILGFGTYLQQPKEQRKRNIEQLLGSQIILSAIFWLAWSTLQISQMGWVSLRQGVYTLLTTFPSIIWAPLLLALGVALLTQEKRTEQLGIVLSVMAYQTLIITSFYLYFASVLAKRFPLRFRMPPQTEIASFRWLLYIAFPLLICLGLLLMKKGVRLRFHLLITSPLWAPFFVVFFFWSLIIHTTLYFIEDLTGITWQPPLVLRVLVLSWLFLPLFPILLSIDFCISLIRFFGRAALDALLPPDREIVPNQKEEASQTKQSDELPATWIYSVGSFILFTLPLWILPVFLYWSTRLFIYESLLLPLLGRPQTPHIVSETSNQ